MWSLFKFTRAHNLNLNPRNAGYGVTGKCTPVAFPIGGRPTVYQPPLPVRRHWQVRSKLSEGRTENLVTQVRLSS